MPRVARLIMYDSDDNERLARELRQSLSEGIHYKSLTTITVINLSSDPVLNGFITKTSNTLDVIDSI